MKKIYKNTNWEKDTYADVKILLDRLDVSSLNKAVDMKNLRKYVLQMIQIPHKSLRNCPEYYFFTFNYISWLIGDEHVKFMTIELPRLLMRELPIHFSYHIDRFVVRFSNIP